METATTYTPSEPQATLRIGRQQAIERWASLVSSTLRGDWGYTGGRIWENGKPVDRKDTYVYLSSTWAVPELDIDDEIIECYKMKSQTPEWDSETYWPAEALAIINNNPTK